MTRRAIVRTVDFAPRMSLPAPLRHQIFDKRRCLTYQGIGRLRLGTCLVQAGNVTRIQPRGDVLGCLNYEPHCLHGQRVAWMESRIHVPGALGLWIELGEGDFSDANLSGLWFPGGGIREL